MTLHSLFVLEYLNNYSSLAFLTHGCQNSDEFLHDVALAHHGVSSKTKDIFYHLSPPHAKNQNSFTCCSTYSLAKLIAFINVLMLRTISLERINEEEGRGRLRRLQVCADETSFDDVTK